MVYQQGEGNVSVQIQGDGNCVTVGGTRVFRLESFAQRAPRKPAVTEVELLDACRETVPFLGRQELLDELHGWLTSGPAIRARVLTGSAGAGKTRLAIEILAHRLAQWFPLSADGKQWQGGFLTRENLQRAVGEFSGADWRWHQPTLVVVDYAGTLGADLRTWLRELALQSPPEDGPALRLLLLDRAASPEIGWYRELVARDALGGSDLRLPEVFDLPQPMELPVFADRRELYAAMAEQAAALPSWQKEQRQVPPLPPLGEEPTADERLASDTFAEPLFLLMAALQAGHDGTASALACNRTDLAWAAAGRHRRWVMHQCPGQPMAPLLVVANTMAGGFTDWEARDLFPKLLADLRQTGDATAVCDSLFSAVPADTPLPPLVPDVVAEAFVLLSLAESRVGEKAQEALLTRLLDARPESTIGFALHTAQDFSHGGRGEVHDHHEEPLRWLDAVVAHGEGSADLLESVVGAIPEQTLALRDLAARVTERLVALARSESPSEDRDVTLARNLNNLGLRLSDLGRREDALGAAEAAVAIRRVLVSLRPDVFLEYLAMSLQNVGKLLGDLGRWEDALRTGEEVCGMYRCLASLRPAEFSPCLAGSLNNLGAFLEALGRREEALGAAEQACGIYRSLASSQPAAFRPDLAMTLNNLGAFLSRLGRREDALGAAEEGCGIYRVLSSSRPDAFLPDLAMSLSNMGAFLNGLGRREEALGAADESVAIRRVLASSRPDAFLPDLADSLNNLGTFLNGLGRRDEALAAAEEACGIYRVFASSRPDVFLPALATSLGVRGQVLLGAGQTEEAVESFAESIRILTPLLKRFPSAFLPVASLLCKNYLEACEKVGIRPDMALLSPVLEVFQSVKAQKMDSE